MTITIPRSVAVRAALNCQLLDLPTKLSGKQGTSSLLSHLGYVQVDTISTIARAHHHTIWTRVSDYNPDIIYSLQRDDRRVFEYWGHAASYLPMEDYRFYLPQKKSYFDPVNKWVKDRAVKYAYLFEPVLARIKDEGALSSKDFEKSQGVAHKGWWDWKPAKTALELLFWRGELMISRRENFIKYYDLPERVLPAHIDTTEPNAEEMGRFNVLRALNAHGFSREKDIISHLGGTPKAIIISSLKDLVAGGEVQQVKIEEVKGNWFVRKSELERFEKLEENEPQIHFLSPFDNLIILRDRVKLLFDFDYSIECYVTEEKRKYGYFVLPILFGERFAGRMDVRADRKNKVFEVKSLFIEPGFTPDKSFSDAFFAKLKAFTRFNGCETFEITRVVPEGAMPL